MDICHIALKPSLFGVGSPTFLSPGLPGMLYGHKAVDSCLTTSMMPLRKEQRCSQGLPGDTDLTSLTAVQGAQLLWVVLQRHCCCKKQAPRPLAPSCTSMIMQHAGLGKGGGCKLTLVKKNRIAFQPHQLLKPVSCMTADRLVPARVRNREGLGMSMRHDEPHYFHGNKALI